MRSILLKTLKILALQGGTRHSIHISSTELAEKLMRSELIGEANEKSSNIY